MFNRTNLLIVVLACASAALGLGLGALLRPDAEPSLPLVQSRILDVGDFSGEVSLPDRDGRTRRLSEWNGKLVVLNFWASWCGPCREEMPMLDRARQRYAERDVEIIGVAAEEASEALAFLQRQPVSYPILINAPDDPIDVSLQFGNRRSVLPYTALIDRNGRLLDTRVGTISEQTLDAWIAPHL
jgi:thiol-disulfide isomerase/thioredoxin